MSFFLLHKRFDETAARFSKKTALEIRVSEREYLKYSYGEALALCKKTGFYLINKGINRQDKVAIILENRPEWPIFYFGILFAGATAVPIDPNLTEAEIKNIISNSETRFVINASNVDEILNNLKDPPSDFNFPETDMNGLCSILYTSGTTAAPKGVALSHKNFSGNFNSINQLGIYNENDNTLSILPLHHSYPFMVTLVMPLLLGATVTYIKTLKPDEITESMKETGVTILVGVPQLFYLFHKAIFEKIKALPFPLRIFKFIISKKVRKNFGARLRFFASGGARLDPKIAKDLAGLGFKILEGYGLTETAPVVTFNPLRKQKFGSVGMPIPDVEIKISGPDKEGIGEVLIKGPNVMTGYYKNQKETDEIIKDGWFYSGDLGYIDKEGYLFLTGRKKEIIVLSSGKNIYPEEIESHYKRSPFIKELCVMGILKEGATEELGAVIVPEIEYFKKTGEVNIREKIKWDLENFSKELSAYKRIMDFVIAKEELPKTSLGKIKRYEVERVYRGQFTGYRPSAIGHQLTKEDLEILNSEVGKKVAKLIGEKKGIKGEIRADDHLELDLGIDSLGRVEMAAGLEKIFNVKIPDEYIAKVFTVKDVVAMVSEAMANAAFARKCGAFPEAGHKISDEALWKVILNKEPEDRIREKIGLSPDYFAKITSLLTIKFLYIIFKLFFGFKVKGRKNIPKKGPFILCPNHTSYFDGFVISAGAPHYCSKELFFLGFREYFIQPVIKNMLKLMRVIPTDPAAELVNAMQASSFVIRNKKSLCIFAEGQRSIDGNVRGFKKGIGILAKELGVALIPVYINGAFEAWPRTRHFPKLHKISIVFGKPLDNSILLESGRQKGARDDYEAVAMGCRDEVVKLSEDV